MDHKKKLKRLNVSLAIGFLLIVISLIIGRSACYAYIFGQITYGEVVEYDVERYLPANFSAGQRPVESHEMLIEYEINAVKHWLVINPHVFSASGIVKKGDQLLLAYSSGQPSQAYVITYALFSPIVPVLIVFIILIFLVIPVQWVYHYRKLNE